MKKSFLILGFALICAINFSQTAIPVAKKVGGTFVNSQGFELSKSIPDTCKVYEGSKGGQFVYRKSKKTGNIYKSYLPKK